jgi:hypothetical protein
VSQDNVIKLAQPGEFCDALIAVACSASRPRSCFARSRRSQDATPAVNFGRRTRVRP